MEKMKCLIFNTNGYYVRTKNFINYTKSSFEHEVIPENKWMRKPLLNQIIKIAWLCHLKEKNWVYVPNLDPMLILTCRLLKINSISDMLEPHPEMYSHSIFKKWFYSIIEKSIVKNSSLVLTVTEEETDNLKRKYGQSNITTIRNFPDLKDFRPSKKKFDKFSIVYFGVCMPSRDLTNATTAIKKLQEKYDIDFRIIGDKKLLSQTFCRYKYHGWLNHKKSSAIISKCHLGIAPYENNPHCNLTLQNKAFQYAACNVIPLSTSLKPLHKYSQIVKLTDNSADGWLREIEKCYLLWKKGKIKFNQREILEKNRWIAENEWENIKTAISKIKG